MATDERPDPLLRIVEYLDELELDYALTGSMAGMFYGLQRPTYDIDIVVDLPPARIDAIVSTLQREYYVDEWAVRDAVRRGVMFNAIPTMGGDKVDLAVLTDDSFQQSVFNRREQHEWHGVPVWVVTAEDLVIGKLRWARESLSERQFSDVRAIMDAGDASDDEYLDEWIRRLGLQDTLDAARSAGHDA